jgi:hypothetical protein
MSTMSFRKTLLPLLAVLCSTASAVAQDWGDKMFNEREIKFGSVARLSDTTYKLKIRNLYVEEIQVSSLSVSCGCISWVDATPFTLKSKEERELTLRLDTVRFTGDRNVRATVSLYEPTRGFSDTVTFPVTARIRTDVEVQPSYIGFGPIDLGKSYTQRIGISYRGGRGDWKILEGKVSNPHLTAEVVETSRQGGTVTYEARVIIDANTPAGVVRDQLVLKTNEPGEANITIPVDARVEADIVITDVQFGSVRPGQPKSMTLVVRGKKAFKIEKVEHIVSQTAAKPTEDGTVPAAANVPMNDAIAVKVPSNTAPLHMLSVTLTPPTSAGMFEEDFAVTIEGRPQPVSFKVKGRVLAEDVTQVQ